MKLEKELWNKIEKRDNLLEEKENEYNDNFPTMFNYPEIRAWYSENISSIDDEIVELANQVLSSHDKELVKDIRDVYNDEFLIELHIKEKSLNNSKKR